MRIRNDVHIEEACSTEKIRPAMGGVMIRKDGYAMATDGHVLAVCKVDFEETDHTSGIYPKEIFKQFRKMKKRDLAQIHLTEDEAILKLDQNTRFIVNTIKEKPFQWIRVITTDPAVFSISLNLEVVEKAAKVLQTKRLHFEFTGQSKQVRVYDINDPDKAFVIIMPITSHGFERKVSSPFNENKLSQLETEDENSQLPDLNRGSANQNESVGSSNPSQAQSQTPSESNHRTDGDQT